MDGFRKHNSRDDVRSLPALCPYLDEPPYYLRGVFGQRLHFAVEDERHQDVFLIGFQHDVAHRHGWSGYCLRRGKKKVRGAYSSAAVARSRGSGGNSLRAASGYLFIKIQCSFEVFEARVDHTTVVVVT